MTDPKLSTEQEKLIAESIRKRKPYLLKIEEEVQRIGFGTIKVVIQTRSGSVDKMEFEEMKSWLRDKES